MAPFSTATGRWCPLLKLQPEFPKEAFHEPEQPQLPPVLLLVSREPSLLGDVICTAKLPLHLGVAEGT